MIQGLLFVQNDAKSKKCSKCKQIKDESKFLIRNKTTGMRRRVCKTCMNEWRRKRYHANHEQSKEFNKRRMKVWRIKNKERNKNTRKNHWQLHKAELAARRAKWREENRDKYDKFKQYGSLWKKANKDKVNASWHKRRAREAVGGQYTTEEWNYLKAMYGFACLRCGKREPDIKLTVDHVVPISKGGSNTIDNIQPLCRPCNSIKHASIIDFRVTATKALA